ncbi:GNAT family N-acetyltransferase [Krasilnikovia sp. MM14-A1259]|uniref:GNAT family N-acetyltransferase n=1 Tax=Krasilnikovia sp. MM14-A1259 TaxID=3373539 RepID=UPI003801188D
MTEEQFLAYRQRAEVDYAQNIADSGSMPLPEAQRQARDDLERLLPDGLHTAGHRLWTAFDGHEEVGMVWLYVEQKSDGLHAFGYDFAVGEPLRRRGYGRAIMLAVEEVCREMGVVSVGLNVFGFNTGARSLYEQMGFEVTSLRMRKRL